MHKPFFGFSFVSLFFSTFLIFYSSHGRILDSDCGPPTDIYIYQPKLAKMSLKVVFGPDRQNLQKVIFGLTKNLPNFWFD